MEVRWMVRSKASPSQECLQVDLLRHPGGRGAVATHLRGRRRDQRPHRPVLDVGLGDEDEVGAGVGGAGGRSGLVTDVHAVTRVGAMA